MKANPILYEKIPYTLEQFVKKYEELSTDCNQHVLLESGQSGRYSICGIDPFATISMNEEVVEIRQKNKVERVRGNPMDVLADFLRPYSFPPLSGLPDFQGGAIGYISYDYVRYIEDIPNLAENDLNMPLIYFLIFDQWVVFDHEYKCLWLMTLNSVNGEERLLSMKQTWQEQGKPFDDRMTKKQRKNDEIFVSLPENDYVSAVKKIQEYIREGDVFQVNLTVRQSKSLDVTPIEVYKVLRKLNPSPYMGYFHTPDFQLVSGSPELLIRKAGMDVSTRPIGGTRSRGSNVEEDERLENELIGSEKERAEHIMLVDIERNDLGKVCAYGSVQVREFMTIEKYSHVMHLVSHISGKLDGTYHTKELINAVFPGGTITGAPKVRTIEIIEELEPVKRGVYTGALGWIGFNGDTHLNIIIRTMLVKDGMCYVQAGARIVIDSNPHAEYKESLKKAAALWKAKEMAENGGEDQ